MESNKFISVSYKLYDITDGKSDLIEQTSDERPFIFVSGMGVTLPAFEEQIVNLAKGESFDFTLTPDQAYGAHYAERIIDLEKEIFTINGQFDAQHVQVGAIIPLQNEDGNRFMGRVVEITDSHVRVDLNHPLAGKDLCFKGSIVENREPREAEIQQLIKMMSGECDCGCGGDCDHQHGDGCGCGHCH